MQATGLERYAAASALAVALMSGFGTAACGARSEEASVLRDSPPVDALRPIVAAGSQSDAGARGEGTPPSRAVNAHAEMTADAGEFRAAGSSNANDTGTERDGTAAERVVHADSAVEHSGSCLEIDELGLSTGDGVYSIRLGTEAPIEVHCLMSVDGGGWTLVGNFPSLGHSSGVPGWTSGEAVGSSFTDLAQPFKLSDADINALRTHGFRAHGTASHCQDGPCAIDTLLFWRATCTYSSSSSSSECSAPYLDAGFSAEARGGTPCEWHAGLLAADCNYLSTFGTSHSGDHVFVGEYESFTHAFDGRPGEDPALAFWVR